MPVGSVVWPLTAVGAHRQLWGARAAKVGPSQPRCCEEPTVLGQRRRLHTVSLRSPSVQQPCLAKGESCPGFRSSALHSTGNPQQSSHRTRTRAGVHREVVQISCGAQVFLADVEPGSVPSEPQVPCTWTLVKGVFNTPHPSAVGVDHIYPAQEQ